MARDRKKSDLDETVLCMNKWPTLKKEGFILLVRTKTRKELRAMKMQAVRDDEDELVTLYDAAERLRSYVEAGIPIHQL